MKVAAFDLSLTRPAVCTSGALDVCQVKGMSGHRRLDKILTWMWSFTYDCNVPLVDVVAIEGYAFGAKGRGMFSIAELGGLVRHGLWEAGLPYVEVPPTVVKVYATGNGNSGKDEVLSSAIRRGGTKFVGQSNDEADAFWLWCLVMDGLGMPVVEVPKTHRRALDKLVLPAGII